MPRRPAGDERGVIAVWAALCLPLLLLLLRAALDLGYGNVLRAELSAGADAAALSAAMEAWEVRREDARGRVWCRETVFVPAAAAEESAAATLKRNLAVMRAGRLGGVRQAVTVDGDTVTVRLEAPGTAAAAAAARPVPRDGLPRCP